MTVDASSSGTRCPQEWLWYLRMEEKEGNLKEGSEIAPVYDKLEKLHRLLQQRSLATKAKFSDPTVRRQETIERLWRRRKEELMFLVTQLCKDHEEIPKENLETISWERLLDSGPVSIQLSDSLPVQKMIDYLHQFIPENSSERLASLKKLMHNENIPLEDVLLDLNELLAFLIVRHHVSTTSVAPGANGDIDEVGEKELAGWISGLKKQVEVWDAAYEALKKRRHCKIIQQLLSSKQEEVVEARQRLQKVGPTHAVSGDEDSLVDEIEALQSTLEESISGILLDCGPINISIR